MIPIRMALAAAISFGALLANPASAEEKDKHWSAPCGGAIVNRSSLECGPPALQICALDFVD
jgi:hypothetical protein